jgi:Flp pilus assembly pilin Flp
MRASIIALNGLLSQNATDPGCGADFTNASQFESEHLRVITLFKKLWAETGATIDYGLIAAGISLVIIAGVTSRCFVAAE